jgi:hypothetical protein
VYALVLIPTIFFGALPGASMFDLNVAAHEDGWEEDSNQLVKESS